MGENTGIEWADHTFNPWAGCTKIAPACDNCYAADLGKRFGWEWGAKEPRTKMKDWKKPLKWERNAEAFEHIHGRKQFVFCASLADVFDNQAPAEWRAELFELISNTPNLIWLLLTKRPQNMAKMLPDDWGNGYENVWLGTTVENQENANRNIPILLETPAEMRFLSIEPMLGPINLFELKIKDSVRTFSAFDGCNSKGVFHVENGVDWVISGGESGPNARPSHPDWFLSLRDQCDAADVPFFFKQWGEHLPEIIQPSYSRSFKYGPGHVIYHRVGKAKAGNRLEGMTHKERPYA